MSQPNSAIIYSGPSMLNGAPIVAIITGLHDDSENTKTGAMVQTWILSQESAPYQAQRSGADSAVCGACPFRPTALGGCYVKTVNAPGSVYRAWQNGRYAPVDPETLAPALSGRMVRLGSYGDPVAVPIDVWRPIVAAARGHTGYTHAWAQPAAEPFRSILMASTETPETLAAAESAGWRTFHVYSGSNLDEPVSASRRIITCPASAESGRRTTCERCGLCNGTGGLSKVSIKIRKH